MLHAGIVNQPTAYEGNNYLLPTVAFIGGAAELSYLKSLTVQDQRARMKQLCEADIPCLVLARQAKPDEAEPHFRDWFLAQVRTGTDLREEQGRIATFAVVPQLDMAGARGAAVAALAVAARQSTDD